MRYREAMGAPARRRATYEDVLAAPEHMLAEVSELAFLWADVEQEPDEG
jgi:hypothetical protein